MRTISPLLACTGSLIALLLVATSGGEAQSLRGSRQSMLIQNRNARARNYSFLQTASGVRTFAQQGKLVKLKGNGSYKLDGEVSFPYARPEVKLFIERTAQQYRKACGEQLVVTSLTRPVSRQPWNASELSVHPTGMAVDLRKSWHRSCRSWLEKTLLTLEQRSAIEATREFWPPHYHVTVFAAPYMRYAKQSGAQAAPSARAAVARAGKSTHGKTPRLAHTAVAAKRGKSVRVGRGDSLWTIAQRHGVSVAALKKANGIRSSRVDAGRRLQIPAR